MSTHEQVNVVDGSTILYANETFTNKKKKIS